MTKPAHQLNGPNAPIRLYDGELEVFRKGISVGGHGSIAFKWFPQPGIAFSLDRVEFERIPNGAKPDPLWTWGMQREGLHLRFPGDVVGPDITSMGWRSEEYSGGWEQAATGLKEPTIWGNLQEDFFKGRGDEVKSVVFHVPNGPNLLADFGEEIASGIPKTSKSTPAQLDSSAANTSMEIIRRPVASNAPGIRALIHGDQT
jgi:hypothetical protein